MKHLFLLVFLFYFVSCTPKSLFNGQEKVITKFPETVNLKAEKIDLEILGVVDILVVDTFFIAYTPMDSAHYCQVYSANTYQYLGSFFPIGRGPGEFYAISPQRSYNTDVKESTTWFSNSLELYHWNITESVRKDSTVINSVIMKKGKLSKGIWFPHVNNTMFGFQVTSNNIQYIQYDGEQINTYSIYPRKVSSKLLSLACMEPYPKPDGAKVAYMRTSTNHFCIFNSDFSDFRAFTIYGAPISLKQALQLERDERIMYYSNGKVTDSYIYAIYLNQKEKDRRYHSGNEEIHIFDWEGNAVLNLVITETIVFFTIDEKHCCLYGLTSDEKIYKYDLSKYLAGL